MEGLLQDNVNRNIEKTIASLTQAKQYMTTEWQKIREEKASIEDLQLLLREDRMRLDRERRVLREERANFDREKKFVEDKNLDTLTQIKLNVGGDDVITSKSTLLSIKGTMIEAMFSGRHKLKTDEQGRYFIDRNLNYFRWVLMYLRSHKLLLPTDKAEKLRVLDEFDYFCIPVEEQSPHKDFLTKSIVNSQTLPSDSWVMCLKVVGDRIIAGYRDNTIKVWNTLTGNCDKELRDDSDINGIEGVDFVDGKIISGSKCLKIWDLSTGNCNHTINDDVLIGFRLFGSRIYSMWEDGGIKIFDAHTGKLERKWDVVGCWAACSDSGARQYVVTESVHTFQFLVWDVISGQCVCEMNGHQEPICYVKIGEKKAISGSYDKTIRVWDLSNGKCIKTLAGHTRSVCALDWIGKVIVSGSVDKTVKIWNMDFDECVITLEGHQNTVSCVEIVGNMIVTGSWDNTIKIWNVVDSPRPRNRGSGKQS